MNGWDEFQRYIDAARTRLEDRYAPVALVCLQATESEDGTVMLEPDRDAVVLWPANFPVPQRGPLLTKISKPYADGTVLRS